MLAISLFLSAFFSSSESALLSTSMARVNSIKNKYIKKLKKNEEEAVISILLGNNLVNVLSSSIAAQISIRVFSDLGIALATFIMTFVLLTFGEVIPKSLALYKKEKLLKMTAKYLYFWFYITSPISKFYLVLMHNIRKSFNVKKAKTITEEEIEEMILLGKKHGELSDYEKEVAVNALDLNDIKVKEIMTPKSKMFLFNALSTVKKLRETLSNKKIPYSRIPIYVKNKDRVIGYVKLNDVLNSKPSKKLISLLRSVLVVDENKTIESLLSMMRKNGIPIAIIKRDGKVLGVVTIQDIIDEILGEFKSEMSLLKNKQPKP